MEIHLILTTSGTAVREALAGTVGFDIENGAVLSLRMVSYALEPFVR